jgi:hypothetical protein
MAHPPMLDRENFPLNDLKIAPATRECKQEIARFLEAAWLPENALHVDRLSLH